MKPAPASRRRRLYLAGAIVLAGIGFTYLQREAMLHGMGRWLNVSGRLEQPVDAVIVLGGGATTRPFVAVEILRAGLAGKILIPKVELTGDNLDGFVAPEQEITQQIVLRSGISADATVLLTSVVDSTEGEALAAAAYLKLHPGERLAVVTSDYHTRRARIMFSRACGRNATNMVFIGAPTDGFNASNWWRCEPGLLAYLTEYLKLARTLAR
jgi:uncharacterized SAM-binding protein YcdF (DUF218 family)